MSAVSTARKKTKTRSEELRRIPANPKYQNVRALVDSGTSVRSYLEKVKDSQKSQQDEIFKRIRLPSFVTLMIQAAKDSLEEEAAVHPVCTLNKREVPDKMPRVKSSLSSVISGMGELDLKRGKDEVLPDVPWKASKPYLLLDVRDSDQYRENHILTASSYPTALLCRTCNYETKELLDYKNKNGKIVILYDYDETIARRAATTLVQRGYDNVFMLTGGLKLAIERFLTGLVTGKLSDRETTVEDKDKLIEDDIAILQVQLDRYRLASSAGVHQHRALSTASSKKSKSPAWR